MSKSKTTDYVLMATGTALYLVGAKTFSDYHEAVALGSHNDFQHRHATAIGSVATLGGLGLAVFGTYRLNKKVGTVAGLGLGALIAYNAVKHAKGEPLISLSPFTPKIGPHHVGAEPGPIDHSGLLNMGERHRPNRPGSHRPGSHRHVTGWNLFGDVFGWTDPFSGQHAPGHRGGHDEHGRGGHDGRGRGQQEHRLPHHDEHNWR
jgi:hypothetical protein